MREGVWEDRGCGEGTGHWGSQGLGGGMGPGGEGAFPSVAAADVPLPTAGPSTVAAALPHAVCKSQSFLALRCPRAAPGGAEQAGGGWGSPPSPIPCPPSCCPWPCTPTRPADRTALGSEARQGGHGHDARGCWGRHQHASGEWGARGPGLGLAPGWGHPRAEGADGADGASPPLPRPCRIQHVSTGPGRWLLLGPGVPSTSRVVPGSAPTAALSPGRA